MATDTTPSNFDIVKTIQMATAVILGALVSLGVMIYATAPEKEILVQKVDVPVPVACPSATSVPQKPAIVKSTAPVVQPKQQPKQQPKPPVVKHNGGKVDKAEIQARIAEIKTPGPIQPIQPQGPMQ